MDTSLLKRESDFEWQIPKSGKMRVPGVIYASEELIRDMDNKVYEQMTNVAMLPGIKKASFNSDVIQLALPVMLVWQFNYHTAVHKR